MQVIEVQKKAGELWNILHSLLTLTEQVLTENIKKDVYVDRERKAQDKRQRVTEEMEAIVRGLYQARINQNSFLVLVYRN